MPGEGEPLEVGSGPRGIGNRLDADTPPALWPLLQSGPLAYRFAKTESGLNFCCEFDRFSIQHVSAWRRKVLTSEPSTADGWFAIWRVMASSYPDLADAVAKAVQTAHVPTTRREAMAQSLSNESALEQVTTCVLLGGYGLGDGAAAGEPCTLFFTAQELVVIGDRAIFEIRSPYARARELEFGGPGVVKTGGRFIGGGFGLTGAAEGMIVASVLNSLTSRTKIHTMIRYQANDLEAFFFHSVETPDQLRIRLSGVLSRIRTSENTPPTSASTDKVAELERLGRLHQDGVLSADEFAQMKRQIIEDR